MGKSAYFMREFTKAAGNFRECLKIDSENYEAKNELKKSLKRINESVTGNYDLNKLFKEFETGNIYMDIAEFQSEKISIVDISNLSKVEAKD